MTMKPNQHPDDERLSALAGADAEALGDLALSGHVDGCHQCGLVVAELRAVRGALATMPDLAPPRPLRLLGAATPERPDRLGGLARRLFAPALTAGAAIALAGVVGTMGDLGVLPGPQSGDSAAQQEAEERDAAGAPDPAASQLLSSEPGADEYGVTTGGGEGDEQESLVADSDLTERSPWPMVAFAGAAIAAAAIILRWILAARPG